MTANLKSPFLTLWYNRTIMEIEIEIDYSGWLTEDLKDFYRETLEERRKVETYSERAQLNQQALLIMAEIQKRNNNE